MAINNSRRTAYLEKIKAIPNASFNREQKEVAIKILESCAESDLDKVYSLITQRVKTGFVFDAAPEVNHNNICLAVENEKLFIKSEKYELFEQLEHKLIIGDNYDALKNLCATYIDKNGNGLIDMIYIDPPYNTEKSKEDGNDYKTEVEASKFVYRDKFTRDGWLNMMNERLKLAKRLLKDTGVIFISIDDREQAYLKVLCDEVFGEQNFVANLPTIMNLKGNQDEFAFAGTHEYTLVFAKNKSSANFNKFIVDEEIIMEEWQEDEFGPYKKGANLKSTGKNAPREKRPNLFYPIYIDSNNSISLEPKENYKELLPITNGQEMSWRWSKEKLQNELYDIIVAGENGEISIYKKQRPALDELPSAKPKTLFYKPKYSSGNGTNQLVSIIGKKLFNNPKPVDLLKDIIFIGASKNAIILDFFAGSGTTGQAVMELNQKDNGKRCFILCTNNENNIATDITWERLYRVINGKGSNGEEIKWEYKKEQKSLTNNQVRVFEIKHNPLTLEDLATAEKLKKQAEEKFKKLNHNYKPNNDFDIYNELSALNPYKD